MISKKTLINLSKTLADIEACEKLIQEIEEAKKNRREPDLRDAFGEPRGLQLGIPSGKNSHRIYNMSWETGLIVIKQHLLNQQEEFKRLNQLAQVETEGVGP